MQDYILEIPDYGYLDTYNDVDASFTYSFQDLSEINSRVAEFSKTITIPGTNNNSTFFKQIFETTITDSFNANKRVRCNVRVSDTTIFKGYLKLEKIINNLEFPEYEITILSIAKNLLELIGDKKLDTLDFTEWNHTRNNVNIVASWDDYIYKNNSAVAFELGRGYVYPKIVYGNATDINDRWYTYDAFPALFVKTIIDKLFETYGYTYTSDFFETEYFKRLILPFTKDKLELDDDQQSEREMFAGIDSGSLPVINSGSALPYQFKQTNNSANEWVTTTSLTWPGAGVGLQDESTLDFNDASGQWDGGVFTCAKQGWYDLDFNADIYMSYEGPLGPTGPYTGTVQYNAGTLKYHYEMMLQKAGGGAAILIADSGRDTNNPYGVLTFQPSDNVAHDSPWVDYNTPLTFTLVASNIYLEPGDKVYIKAAFSHPNDVTWGGLAPIVTAKPMLYRSVNGNFNTFEARLANNILMGQEDINMQQILPNMKISELLEGIIQLFNLSFNTNPADENNIIIEPTENYLKSKQKTKDWSKLLDRESYELEPTANLTSQTYLYKYTDDDDYFNKTYTNTTNESYGQIELTTDNDFNIQTEQVELPFAPTPDASDFGVYNTVQPYFVEVDKDNRITPKSVKPRILFYGGVLTGETYRLLDYPNDTNFIETDTYPYCGHWDHPTNPRWDLNFGPTQKIYWNSNAYPTHNVFNQFHRNTLEAIINENGRVLTGDFYLTPTDISDIDPRDIIYIDGVYYRILEIKDYNPIAYDKLTQVSLLKIVDFEKYISSQTSTPSFAESCPVDVQVRNTKTESFLFSPSGETVTEQCCNAYGGVWVNGTCYITNLTGDLTHPSGTPAPVPEPNGPIKHNDGNAINSTNVVALGKGNVSAPGSTGMIIGDANGTSNAKSSLIVGEGNSTETPEPALIVGKNNAVEEGETNTNPTSIILGNNITIKNGEVSSTIGGTQTPRSIVTLNSKPVVVVNFISAGRDEVLNPFPDVKPENYINAGRDAVRNLGAEDLTDSIKAGRDEIL